MLNIYLNLFICCGIVLRTYNIDHKVSLNGDREKFLAKDHILAMCTYLWVAIEG